MKDYAAFSIETHLFFARIMKEHSLFLEAGFQGKDKSWIQKADWFRKQFEELLWQSVRIGDGMINASVLKSQELVTRFTISAEKQTHHLTGIPIDGRISMMEQELRSGCGKEKNGMVRNAVRQINKKALRLLNGLIDFKEAVLKQVRQCQLFTANYPLLIEHIIREAKLYRSILMDLERDGKLSCEALYEKENFWNQIMMEHALFIRGLLDPSEMELIETADDFAAEYRELLETARAQDCKAGGELTEKSLKETLKYREFKTAGTKGILECETASLILPLLADHVLREANHYIRILECDCAGGRK